ncbi:unnamed protein product [Tenebrio molitor]|nr:unnamed protein product [Tenebrio molitor]
MPAQDLHTQYIIKCPKDVDPTQINPECFEDFIPPNVTVVEVRGLILKQEKKTCRWEITVQLQGGAEVYDDNVKRSNLRTEIDSYKPRNTNLLGEKKGVKNGKFYWIFEYEIVCDCALSPVFLEPKDVI